MNADEKLLFQTHRTILRLDLKPSNPIWKRARIGCGHQRSERGVLRECIRCTDGPTVTIWSLYEEIPYWCFSCIRNSVFLWEDWWRYYREGKRHHMIQGTWPNYPATGHRPRCGVRSGYQDLVAVQGWPWKGKTDSRCAPHLYLMAARKLRWKDFLPWRSDKNLQYAPSTWKQPNIWNIQNAQKRIKIVVPIGTSTTDRAKDRLNELKAYYNEDTQIDDLSGEVTINCQPKFSFNNTYIFPSKEGTQTEISEMGVEGYDLNSTEQLKYWWRRFIMETHIPANRFMLDPTSGPNNPMNGDANITREEYTSHVSSETSIHFQGTYRQACVDSVLSEIPSVCRVWTSPFIDCSEIQCGEHIWACQGKGNG